MEFEREEDSHSHHHSPVDRDQTNRNFGAEALTRLLESQKEETKKSESVIHQQLAWSSAKLREENRQKNLVMAKILVNGENLLKQLQQAQQTNADSQNKNKLLSSA